VSHVPFTVGASLDSLDLVEFRASPNDHAKWLMLAGTENRADEAPGDEAENCRACAIK